MNRIRTMQHMENTSNALQTELFLRFVFRDFENYQKITEFQNNSRAMRTIRSSRQDAKSSNLFFEIKKTVADFVGPVQFFPVQSGIIFATQ